MFKINYLLLILALAFVFSCKPDEPKAALSWSLVPSGEKIILSLDEKTSNVSLGLEFFEASKPLLFSADQNSNSLLVFDLENQKLEKKITFEREGDQGVRVGYFHVHRLDSIFIFPQMSPFIILTDTTGQIKNRLRYTLSEGYPMIFPHNSYYVSTPSVAGKELVVKLRADGRITEFTQEKLDTVALLAAIDLETGVSRLLPYGFPTDYLSRGLKQLEYSLVSREDRIVVSFMGDHRIFTTTLNSGDWESREVGSGFLEETMPTLSKDVDGRGFSEYFFAKSRYESLIYDSYRKVYYRFAFPTVAVESDEQLSALRSSPGAFVVMVLDEDLNVLTERKFEAGSYLPSNFFVGKKGLYLSVNHPDNPENREDLLAFELLELKK